MKSFSNFAVMGLFVALVGCGGGGGGDSPSTSTPVPTPVTLTVTTSGAGSAATDGSYSVASGTKVTITCNTACTVSPSAANATYGVPTTTSTSWSGTLTGSNVAGTVTLTTTTTDGQSKVVKINVAAVPVVPPAATAPTFDNVYVNKDTTGDSFVGMLESDGTFRAILVNNAGTQAGAVLGSGSSVLTTLNTSTLTGTSNWWEAIGKTQFARSTLSFSSLNATGDYTMTFTPPASALSLGWTSYTTPILVASNNLLPVSTTNLNGTYTTSTTSSPITISGTSITGQWDSSCAFSGVLVVANPTQQIAKVINISVTTVTGAATACVRAGKIYQGSLSRTGPTTSSPAGAMQMLMDFNTTTGDYYIVAAHKN